MVTFTTRGARSGTTFDWDMDGGGAFDFRPQAFNTRTASYTYMWPGEVIATAHGRDGSDSWGANAVNVYDPDGRPDPGITPAFRNAEAFAGSTRTSGGCRVYGKLNYNGYRDSLESE
jgi:hypothetical protein